MKSKSEFLSAALAFLGKLGGRARKILGDPKKLEQVLSEAKAKAEGRTTFEQGFEYLGLMIRLVAAYVRGVYRKVSYETVALILAAIIYFLFPLDVLPDPIYVDDAAVLMFVGLKVKSELEAFAAWEKQHSTADGSTVGFN